MALKIVYKLCCEIDVHDCSIVLAHSKYIKAIRGKKADRKDAKWIADTLLHYMKQAKK